MHLQPFQQNQDAPLEHTLTAASVGGGKIPVSPLGGPNFTSLGFLTFHPTRLAELSFFYTSTDTGTRARRHVWSTAKQTCGQHRRTPQKWLVIEAHLKPPVGSNRQTGWFVLDITTNTDMVFTATRMPRHQKTSDLGDLSFFNTVTDVDSSA